MQICKNKASGKYSIYIEDEGNDKASLVLTTGEVKSLKLILFEEIKEGNGKDFLSRGLIKNRQVKEYRAEVKKREIFNEMERKKAAQRAFEDLPDKEKSKKFLEWLEKLSPDEQKKAIEKIKARLLDE